MTEFNPYKAPDTAQLTPPRTVVGHPVRVPLGSAPMWIVAGYQLFARRWPTWLAIMSIFIFVFILLQVFVAATSAFLIGEIIGSLIALPLLIGGIVTSFHWLAQDKPLPVVSMFAGFVTRPGALIAGGLIAYVIMGLLVLLALQISGLTFADYLVLIQGRDQAAINTIITSPTFFSFVGWITPLMLPATVAYYFTLSQIALSRIPVISALINSWRAVLGNLHVLLWGFIVLFFVGMLLLLLMSMIFALLSVLPVDPDSTLGLTVYAVVFTLLIGAPAIACLFGINYAAFHDIFMRPAATDSNGAD